MSAIAFTSKASGAIRIAIDFVANSELLTRAGRGFPSKFWETAIFSPPQRLIVIFGLTHVDLVL
jgi:hypothetical protein